MRKKDFLNALRRGLAGLPQQDIEERLDFYAEAIDDRIEEGLSEEDAVRDLGTVEDVVAQILSEMPLLRLAKERLRPKRKLRTWEIVLLTATSPIWFSLAVAALSVLISLYAVLWAVVASLWAVFGALCGGAVCGIAGLALGLAHVEPLVGFAMFGAGICCAGLAILTFFGCMEATKGSAVLAKRIILGIKKCFVGREN